VVLNLMTPTARARAGTNVAFRWHYAVGSCGGSLPVASRAVNAPRRNRCNGGVASHRGAVFTEQAAVASRDANQGR
jgi:hypothetical protein